VFTFAAAAYNLVRMRKLRTRSVGDAGPPAQGKTEPLPTANATSQQEDQPAQARASQNQTGRFRDDGAR